MSKIMYKTNTVDDIEKVKVERETRHTIWTILPGDRDVSQLRKTSDSCNFFDTFCEAKSFLIERYNKTINELESSLSYQKKRLEKVMNLDENDC